MSYLPEGRLIHTAENRAVCAALSSLRTAAERGAVLEGRAELCTPGHDLIVRAGPFLGTIPREETALGIREGTVREIAILSRVGRPVSFLVTGFDLTCPEPRLLLSRRRAQEKALERLLRLPPGTVLPATVTHLERFGAFVDIGCGVISMIGVENISVSRIPHPDRRFRQDQEIFAVLTGSDREKGRLFLSHRELLGTWQENAERFAPGMTVPAFVRGTTPYGVFLELTPNLSGLSDPKEGLREDERVSVFIRSIRPERMKIKLTVVGRLPPAEGPEPLEYRITSGRLTRWVYPPPGCIRPPVETVFAR